MRGSAVYRNHNSYKTYQWVIALWYFFLSGAYREDYWMEFDKISYNGKAQWEEVQYTGTITLIKLINELLPFDTFSCLEHNMKTSGWNLVKLHTFVKNNERKWSIQEPYLLLNLLVSYCPLILFLVWSIPWRLLDRIL